MEYTSYVLDFKFSPRTSRGAFSDHKVWYVKITDKDGVSGIGEVAPIERLSPDDVGKIPDELEKLKAQLQSITPPNSIDELFGWVQMKVSPEFPSIRFALETAMLDLMNGGEKKIFATSLSSIDIPINGLVWMGGIDHMKEQIEQKLDEGFQCIKLKIGALDFQAELDIIKDLRSVSDELVIRLDANGLFKPMKC